MISQRPLAWGMVGAGHIAQAYAQAFSACWDARLVAISDTHELAARRLAKTVGCASFGSHLAMAAEMDLDAVLVCTPPHVHATVCRDVLQAGIAVLCEKPFGTGIEQALAIAEAARCTDTLVSMASKYRFVEDVQEAKRVVDEGCIGEIQWCDIGFTAHVDMRHRWNAEPLVSGGGVLRDNGSHAFDLMRFFLGPLASVQAVEGARPQDLRVEETVHCVVRSQAGALGQIDLSWSLHKSTSHYIMLCGTQGTLTVGWQGSGYQRSGSSTWVPLGKGYDKLQALRRQVEHMSEAIRGTEPLCVTLEDALASVYAIEGAYKALRCNRWEMIEPQASGSVAGGSAG
ncbi:Gfo/Idh/MocA family protein [Candidatus Entotheonella palauensis]|uniref:Gfo/Idh/MocA family protein n=1 Tax=Candidatus Entotheonella palauensis TaxID=93172 RepID=UPI000B7CEE37|nr:Gfo/Idh/MocA family oxidoreductase [Candidatus Entotheonella palauensis]